ncbi:MotA/TolQ/ExbB proton channel family protein [Pseudemcibacter aquimaris]|uniref:MotA/TolQ/ExbB proton channel family protein n=1 Tax=Pseudemcibacter aquimaris TaxID=2857064 RepID=UPI0020114CD5|nr:MotA/TolQ/ExbB proton channel family protein [Pseudemcibacter aquimaris]MCC3862280.1 MotA/TolQ/ExbB proton channel family protein [Pseudemcibacter aquimaris]WDU59030.1 MotA/TolQ/ExbB proton channel family protein [Pseudemcibacter aquimaris]
MRKFLNVVIAIALSGFAFSANAQEAANLDELLEIVRQGKVNESAEFRQREQEFRNNQAQQQQLLADANASQRAEERRSDQLEAQFAANDDQLAALETEFTNELGALKEVLGVLTMVAGDARSQMEQSLTTTQFEGRDEFITSLIEKTSSGTQLPSIEEIERLWFEVQREMTEQGRVVTFDRSVKMTDGSEETLPVTRIGVFNIATAGKYLKFEQGLVAELDRQPEARFVESTAALQGASSGVAPFGVDPSRGSILALLIQAPSLRERVDFGGTIGYLILGVGAIGILLWIERVIYLTAISGKVKAQIKSDVVNENNPLGRILAVHEANKGADVETLELKIDEAILKEMPPLERFLTMIKLISAIAPLMGLLGTVTGMINTFQSMTLFGTGDPKLMAGGISQALVTTVLGIVVALPTLFLHSIVNGMSQRVVHTLEEQSAGIIAVHAEQNKGA